jgi:hypothetical protein
VAVSRAVPATFEAVLAAAPVSTAMGYELGRAPLTAVRLDCLADRPALLADAEATLDRPASVYDLLVFGRSPDHRTHALRDFAWPGRSLPHRLSRPGPHAGL